MLHHTPDHHAPGFSDEFLNQSYERKILHNL